MKKTKAKLQAHQDGDRIECEYARGGQT